MQIKVDRTGATLYCGAMDIGQGSDMVLAQVAAEELGLEPRDIRLVTADTDLTPVDLGPYASRGTFRAGTAAREAARGVGGPGVKAVGRRGGSSFRATRSSGVGGSTGSASPRAKASRAS